MYLGKKNFYNPVQAEANRAELIKTKSGAVANAFIELDGLLNKTQFVSQYFGKSHGWFSQKLNGSIVCDKKRAFDDSEYKAIADAFRHIAERLMAHADEIDSAKEVQAID